jgi:hypothetical protein
MRGGEVRGAGGVAIGANVYTDEHRKSGSAHESSRRALPARDTRLCISWRAFEGRIKAVPVSAKKSCQEDGTRATGDEVGLLYL